MVSTQRTKEERTMTQKAPSQQQDDAWTIIFNGLVEAVKMMFSSIFSHLAKIAIHLRIQTQRMGSVKCVTVIAAMGIMLIA